MLCNLIDFGKGNYKKLIWTCALFSILVFMDAVQFEDLKYHSLINSYCGIDFSSWLHCCAQIHGSSVGSLSLSDIQRDWGAILC